MISTLRASLILVFCIGLLMVVIPMAFGFIDERNIIPLGCVVLLLLGLVGVIWTSWP